MSLSHVGKHSDMISVRQNRYFTLPVAHVVLSTHIELLCPCWKKHNANNIMKYSEILFHKAKGSDDCCSHSMDAKFLPGKKLLALSFVSYLVGCCSLKSITQMSGILKRLLNIVIEA